MAKRRADELEASTISVDALRADASSRRDLIIQQHANSLADNLKCSYAAALPKTMDDYCAFSSVVIAEYNGDLSEGR